MPSPLPRDRPSDLHRNLKLTLAADRDESGGSLGCFLLPALLGSFVLGFGLMVESKQLVWKLAGGALFVAGLVAMWHFQRVGKRMQAARDAKLAAHLDQRPFPTEGYLDWIAADEPLLDITFATAPDRESIAARTRELDPAIALDWQSDRVVRVAIPPAMLRVQHNKWPAVYGGDRAKLDRLLDRIASSGIERIELGGRVRRDIHGRSA